MHKKSQITLFILLGLIILLSFAAVIYFVEYSTEKKSEEQLEKIYRSSISKVELQAQCIDNTNLDQCSQKQPLLCNPEGRLVDDCRQCGCPDGLTCWVDGSCKDRKPSTATPDFKIYFVPINYHAGDIDFISRLTIYKEYLKRYLDIKEENFEIVDLTLTVPPAQCDKAGEMMSRHVGNWFQQKNGKALPNLKMKGAIPVSNYRIIGIDSKEQDLEKCGCGYTVIYSPLIYIGGSECSRVDHAAVHELGHTFGLCDEYDTCVWDDTNQFMELAFAHPCLNRKPNPRNSDCSLNCCSEGTACCSGKYADTISDEFYNIMGSADVPPQRRLSSETTVLANNFLCDNLGMCGGVR